MAEFSDFTWTALQEPHKHNPAGLNTPGMPQSLQQLPLEPILDTPVGPQGHQGGAATPPTNPSVGHWAGKPPLAPDPCWHPIPGATVRVWLAPGQPMLAARGWLLFPGLSGILSYSCCIQALAWSKGFSWAPVPGMEWGHGWAPLGRFPWAVLRSCWKIKGGKAAPGWLGMGSFPSLIQLLWEWVAARMLEPAGKADL